MTRARQGDSRGPAWRRLTTARMGRILASLLFLALLSGCATTSHAMLGPARAPLSPEQVQVYSTPPARYLEIALLETASGPFTYGEQNKMDSVLAKLRREAARLGANGILLQGVGNGYRGGGVNVGVGGGSFGGHTHIGGGVGVDISPTRKHAQAVAIYVTP
jgi:hypothetical protein